MTLKRISDEEIKRAVRNEVWPNGYDVDTAIIQGAQAQLEANQEKYKELQDKYEARGELMAGQKKAHNAVIKSLFEAVDEYIKAAGDFQRMADTKRNALPSYGRLVKAHRKLQALKQKYLGGK